MKKQYMIPVMTTVVVSECLPIAASNPGEDGVKINKDDDGIAPGAFGTKDQHDWDIWSE